MATLGKHGYNWTGYTEPFIAPVIISATGPLSGKDMGVNGITGAVAIEYTEFRNSGLYVRANADSTGTSFTSKDLNIDTRMDAGFTTVGKWIISTDWDGVTTNINSSTNVTVDSVEYNNVTGVYTVTVNSSITVTEGTAYKVIGRVLDVGSVVSVGYSAGDRVVEPYTPDERLYTQP